MNVAVIIYSYFGLAQMKTAGGLINGTTTLKGCWHLTCSAVEPQFEKSLLKWESSPEVNIKDVCKHHLHNKRCRYTWTASQWSWLSPYTCFFFPIWRGFTEIYLVWFLLHHRRFVRVFVATVPVSFRFRNRRRPVGFEKKDGNELMRCCFGNP